MESKNKCVFGCGRLGAYKHRFPHPEKRSEMFQVWIKIVGDNMHENDYMKIYKSKRVCHYHFRPEDKLSGHRISKSAVPTLHLKGVLRDAPIEIQLEHNYALPHMIDRNSSSSQPCSSQHQDESGSTSNEDIYTKEVPSLSIPQSSAFLQPKEIGFVEANSLIQSEHNYSLAITQSKECPHGSVNGCGNRIKILKTIKVISRKNHQLQKQLTKLKLNKKSFKSRLLKLKEMCLLDKMTIPGQLITKIQLKEAQKKPKGRRFSLDQKKMSLMIYKRSPKSYRFFSNLFSLPSSRTLQNLLQKIEIKPGINDFIFKKLKDSASKLFMQDRLCTLIFDEMSISPQLHYSPVHDELKGFVNHSTEIKLANHVLVFMVKGIRKPFKQPVAYYFTNSLNKVELKHIIQEIVIKVHSTGLKILCTVCDQSAVNVSAINTLIEETKDVCIKNNNEWKKNTFQVGKHTVIPLYDVPHLIKGLRNNIISKKLTYEYENKTKMLVWEHFKMVYQADKSYGELRLCPKLTEEHINPEKINKMRVKLATQLFSHSVAVAAEHLTGRGDLPQECRDIIPFVKLIDEVFDSLNCSTMYIQNGKVFRAAIRKGSPHHELWQKAIKILKSVKFTQESIVKNKIHLKERVPPSVTNLIKTIEGVQEIWNIVTTQYSYDCLLSRNMNQDPVENFFGHIRSLGCRNVRPNAVNFESAYKTLIINNFTSYQSKNTNCEEDFNESLANFDYLLKENVKHVIKKNESIVLDDIFYNVCHDSQVTQGLQQREYVCGWVLKKCLEKIVKKCNKCKKDLLSRNNDCHNSFIKCKEYCASKKWLCYPTRSAITCFLEIQNITSNCLQNNYKQLNIKKEIKTICDAFIQYPFSCHKHRENLKLYFTDITINVLIFSWCRSVNRILSGKLTYDENQDQIKIYAQAYYNKYRHTMNKLK